MVQLKYSHILVESFARWDRPSCIRVHCHMLIEATDNIQDVSGPSAVKCIRCQNKQASSFYIIDSKLRPRSVVLFVVFFSLKICLLVWVKCEKLP